MWALDIVSRVKSGAKVEHSLVELKAEWPSPERAARRLAGHANAALGSDILWIIGLDEVRGLVGVESGELSNWWSSVCANFDGVSPAMTDILLHVDGITLHALVFETVRAPFIVKNPLYGKQGGGPVEREVPWREGTAIRSATRSDLIRLLSPVMMLPEIEHMGGSVTLRTNESYPERKSTVIGIWVSVPLYLTPRSEASIVIPFHRCKLEIRGRSAEERIDFEEMRLSVPNRWGQRNAPDTATLESTSSELIAHGPGKCTISSMTKMRTVPDWMTERVSIRAHLAVVDASTPLLLEMTAVRCEPKHSELARWEVA
jgi:hypothetical protein